MSEVERKTILDRLDAADQNNPAKNKRHGSRITFRKNDVLVRVIHPGGSATSCMVSTRNLSSGGTSFLYEGFLYKGTKIEMVLKRRLGGEDTIRGSVQHCQLISRNAHLVGMKFEAPIFPKMFVDPSEWGELEEDVNVDPATLLGTVLHLDDQNIDRLLITHYLKSTKITLISTSTIGEASAKLKENEVDVVLCDLNLEDGKGEDAIKRMRAEGFVGQIALVTSETSAARLKEAQVAGASAVLSKPFEATRLISLLATWIGGGSDGMNTIVSTLPDTAENIEMIEQYVPKLRQFARDLRTQINANNTEGVRKICQVIKGTGAGFGFEMLSNLARDAVHCLDAGSSIKESGAQLQQLESACLRAHAQKAA